MVENNLHEQTQDIEDVPLRASLAHSQLALQRASSPTARTSVVFIFDMFDGLISQISQRVTDALVAADRERKPSRIRQAVLHRTRRAILRASDPLVRYRLGASELLLPLSHDLPHYCASWPLYSRNLGRIAASLRRHYRDLFVVDIGANVGDSAAIVHNEVDVPVLCIEGDDQFLRILEVNLARIGGDFEVASCYIGPKTAGAVHTSNGTARITPHRNGKLLNMRSLAEVLLEHPRFASAKLIKIDTDGFDCTIIRHERPLLERLRPVIFFEYDPKLARLVGDNCDDLFEDLRAAGYGQALFYDNLGEFLLGANLNDTPVVADIKSYFARHHHSAYADVCVFPEEDRDVFEEIREAERSFLSHQP